LIKKMGKIHGFTQLSFHYDMPLASENSQKQEGWSQ